MCAGNFDGGEERWLSSGYLFVWLVLDDDRRLAGCGVLVLGQLALLDVRLMGRRLRFVRTLREQLVEAVQVNVEVFALFGFVDVDVAFGVAAKNGLNRVEVFVELSIERDIVEHANMCRRDKQITGWLERDGPAELFADKILAQLAMNVT